MIIVILIGYKIYYLNRERFKKDVLVKNCYETKFQKMEEERTDALEMAEKENEERKAQEKARFII